MHLSLPIMPETVLAEMDWLTDKKIYVISAPLIDLYTSWCFFFLTYRILYENIFRKIQVTYEIHTMS